MTPALLRHRDFVILGAILLIAAVLRLIGLNAPLWFDEIITLLAFVRLPVIDLLTDYSVSNNHMFYSLQAKAVIALFGEHNWSLRLPAALFGVAGIAAIWWLARSVAGAAIAHVTAALIALSYHHIWFSQNARGYTELMFWSVLATILFIEGNKNPTLRTWMAYAAVIAAAFYTHLTAGFIVVAHGLVYLALLTGRYANFEKWPDSLKASTSIKEQLWPIYGFALAGIITLVLYAPILMDVVSSFASVSSESRADVMPEYQNPLWAVLEAARTLSNGDWVMIVGLPAALILTALGIWDIGRREPLLAAIIIVHIAVTFAILTAMSMRIWPRFFFADLGFIFFAITMGVFLSCGWISEVLRRWSGIAARQSALFGIAVVLMVAISAVLASRNYQFPKQDLRGAYEFVEARRTEGDVVLTLGWSAIAFNDYFDPSWQTIETVEEFNKLKDKSDQAWLVFGFPARTTRKYADIMEIVERDFALERVFRGTLGDGNVLVYLRKEDDDSFTG